MRKLKTPVYHIGNVKDDKLIDPRLFVPVQTRVIDTVCVETFKSPLDGAEIVYTPNDISLLVNQSKFASFNPEIVKSIVSEYSRSSQPLSQLMSGRSDEDIISSVKSRYIQSHCDMADYVHQVHAAISSEVDSINQQRHAAAAAAQQQQQTNTTE